ITQWSKGEYPLANNTEDDLAIIASYVGYRVDDHANSIGGATLLTGTSVSASGIVERNSDADVFSFNTGAGPVSFTLTGAPRGANLDALLALYDGTGNLITSVNGTGLNSSLSASVAAGTYYLLVDGAGEGDLATGYSDYASLGQFTLSGTIQSPAGIAPTANATATPTSGTAPLNVSFSSAGSFDSDGSIVGYDWNFGDGGTSTVANPSHTYNAAGTYTATLVVRDNSGLTGVDSVVINVNAPANQSPVAVANATPISGTVPLTVNFSSAGSYDPDGSIASYSWTFGDGGSSTAVNPSHTYNAAGTYVATLVVTDNQGATGTRTVSITVAPNPANVVFVSNISMSLVTLPSGTSGRAVVTITDSAGNVRPGASVTGSWSGLASGTSTGTTDAAGNVSFTSKKTRKSGAFTFTVTGVGASGYTYDASRNVETSDSVINP
ncbi:MAG TPA: PKD domain-containing protein, partial [Verrucomicrobiae bacterium]